QAHNGLGGALQALGRIEESRGAIERAITLAPGNASYYHRLASITRFAPGDPHVSAMQALARDMERLRPSDRIALHFALGKAYAEMQDHEGPCSHYAKGNARPGPGVF